jgi:3-oxoacyl-[acyl-carrier protein] reductase
MDLGLQDKVVFITGASSGIGAAAARLFAREGADVVVSYGQNEGGARATADAVVRAGRRTWPCRMDVADADAVARAVERVGREVGGLDALVLCAGWNRITPFESLTPAEWNQAVSINLNGAFYVLHAALPLLRDGSSVVTVASVSAHTGAPHHAHYSAAKAGLIGLTKSAARALGPRVRVNCVAPGMPLTPMGEDTAAALPRDDARRKLLVQRFAEPDEIARSIVFLASPAAAFITGTTLDADGGRALR